MQPRDFIDFISGKFVRRFIADRASLERAMQRLDDSADADGRYRVNYFSCGIDIWRAAFAELLSSSDVVLMDLRGFDSATHWSTLRAEADCEIASTERRIGPNSRTDMGLVLEALQARARPGSVPHFLEWTGTSRDAPRLLAVLSDAATAN